MSGLDNDDYKLSHTCHLKIRFIRRYFTLIALVTCCFSVINIQDEAARVALCDNQHWLPVVVLLGLVSCSIPPSLKAELLLTLAAFAKSPEISASLWQSIEVSQVRKQ